MSRHGAGIALAAENQIKEVGFVHLVRLSRPAHYFENSTAIIKYRRLYNPSDR